jgi:Na+-driven multidrug efflux pump
MPFMGFYILCGMFLQNIGQFGKATLVTIAENGTFLIPAMLIMPRLFGLDGLIYCRSAASVAALILSLGIGIRAWNKYLKE